MKVLVTGSSGLIGSEATEHFDRQGHEVVGVDNNTRRVFFGPGGDNLERLKSATKCFKLCLYFSARTKFVATHRMRFR